MENKKGLQTKAPILSAAIILLIGIIDVAATTKFFSDIYGGLLSFIVGQNPYTSAIIAGIVWIVLAVAVLFLVKYIKRIPRKALIIGGAAIVVIMAVLVIVQPFSNKAPTRDEVKTWFNAEFGSQSELEFQSFGGNDRHGDTPVLTVWYTVDLPYETCKLAKASQIDSFASAGRAAKANIQVSIRTDLKYDNINVDVIMIPNDYSNSKGNGLCIITENPKGNNFVYHPTKSLLWGAK